MDSLCRWAWAGAEWLLSGPDGDLSEGIDKTKVGLVLMTRTGCLEADKKYLATMPEIPSPALFVYTLPNIMLGEISIRHGFKGEQQCLLTEAYDPEQLRFWADAMISLKGMDACLAGWVDTGDKQVYMTWMKKETYT